MKPEFVKMLADLGDTRFDRLAETLETTRPEVSVRLNPRKAGRQTPMAATADSRVDWWDGGIYLGQRPRFTADPALHQGRYYVQDASSMVTSAIARHISAIIAKENAAACDAAEAGGDGQLPLLWLDACAAPGGKTTAALDGLPDGSLVVANEYDYSRAEILKENVAKWGGTPTVITRGDTAQFRRLGGFFDVIAVDAPCSGEGMMRKDLTAREQWTPSLVVECAARQREILGNLWETLRPGGFLVYSTCTFNTAEDELMADWLRREHGAIPVDTGIIESVNAGASSTGEARNIIDREIEIPGVEPLHSLRFIPGRARGEGLYMTVMRKPGNLIPAAIALSGKDSRQKKGKQKKQAPDRQAVSRQTLDLCRGWLQPTLADAYAVSATDDGVRAFPRLWQPLLPAMLRDLQVISAGTEMAVVKGRDIIPTQQFALSLILSPSAFPAVEVGSGEAVDYLAREAVTLPEGTPRGVVMLTYDGWPLGFVKNLGNRTNSLYPKEWRIRNIT